MSLSLPPDSPPPSVSAFDKLRTAVGLPSKKPKEMPPEELKTFKVHKSAVPVIGPGHADPIDPAAPKDIRQSIPELDEERPLVPSLANHTIMPTPLEAATQLKFSSKKEQKDYERNQTNIKVQKTRAKILGGAALPLFLLGIPFCVFPPVGAVMILGGVLLGAGALYNALKSDLTDSQKERAEMMKETLDLFDQYPKADPNKPGAAPGFADFLETCPTHTDPRQGNSYFVEDLSTYISLFKKELQRHEQQEKLPILETELIDLKKEPPEVTALKDEIENLADTLGVDVKDYQKALQRSKKDQEQLKTQKNEKESQEAELIEAQKLKNSQLTTLKDEINTLLDKRPDESEIAQLHQTIKDKEAQAQKMGEELNELGENLVLVQGQLANIKEETAQVETRMKGLQELEGKIEEKDAAQAENTKAITSKQKKIDSLKKSNEALEKAIAEGKTIIEKHIKIATAEPYRDFDERTYNPDLVQMLDKWKKETKELENLPVEFAKSPPAIFSFGNLATKPTHAIAGSDTRKVTGPRLRAGLEGIYLNIPKQRYAELGRTASNDFLSNAYAKEIEIDGETYPSVTHYLIIKKAEKLIARTAPSMEEPFPLLNDKQKQALIALQKKVKEVPTAEEAVKAARTVMSLHMHGYWQPDSMFSLMDAELKEALFCKFIGPDGQVTLEGQRLLETGDKKLYAGNELGDLSYGLQFMDHGVMTGQNKLGVFLEELRSMLQEKEKKAAAPAPATPVPAAPPAGGPPNAAKPTQAAAAPVPKHATSVFDDHFHDNKAKANQPKKAAPAAAQPVAPDIGDGGPPAAQPAAEPEFDLFGDVIDDDDFDATLERAQESAQKRAEQKKLDAKAAAEAAAAEAAAKAKTAADGDGGAAPPP